MFPSVLRQNEQWGPQVGISHKSMSRQQPGASASRRAPVLAALSLRLVLLHTLLRAPAPARAVLDPDDGDRHCNEQSLRLLPHIDRETLRGCHELTVDPSQLRLGGGVSVVVTRGGAGGGEGGDSGGEFGREERGRALSRAHAGKRRRGAG